MLNAALPHTSLKSYVYPVLTVVAAATIFFIDTFTPLNIAIAVIYVAVVMISANFLSWNGVLAVAGLCVLLTVGSFAIVHGIEYDNGALIRCAVSLSAILVTTVLALKNHEATHSVKEQAALLDLTHDAIFVRNSNDEITYWNAGAEELYGWKASEAVGIAATHLLRTKLPVPASAIAEELDKSDRWQGEIVHMKRDGSSVAVASRWSLQRDDRGRPVATMETNSDITEKKHAEDELHKAQSELAHVTRITTLGELTASIAHEVNQPLAAVVTNGEAALRWLQRDVPDLKEVQSSVERMISNGRRASDVVARLRALARKTDLMMSPLDLNEIIDDVLMLVERELYGHNIAPTVDLARTPLPVLGDRVQLQQALINLVMNAIQAMSDVHDRPRMLSIGSKIAGENTDKKSIIVEVVNSGPGIDPAIVNKLFTAFYTTKPEGMGMGLSICRTIVESHGGKITVSSNPGFGAKFVASFPMKEDGQT